jgi:hypothetical protein
VHQQTHSIAAVAFKAWRQAGGKPAWRRECREFVLELHEEQAASWLISAMPDGSGLALRVLAAPAGGLAERALAEEDGTLRLSATSPGLEHETIVRIEDDALPVLRATMTLTPDRRMRPPRWSRDLIVLGPSGDPEVASGRVEAAQRGLNSGLVFARLEACALGGFLYFQNLTALNPYFAATGTIPDGAVGGEWPELGYRVPCDGEGHLVAGRRVTVSDALLVIRPGDIGGEAAGASAFLTLLGEAYARIDRPRPAWHDWQGRAARTLRDLDRAPEATVRHYGHRYVHPYTAAEYPDSMVQAVTAASLGEYARSTDVAVPLLDELVAGMPRFYDAKLKALRRYLPNVGNDKNANAVDSWYFYHPMVKLGALAQHGNGAGRRLFLKTLDFAIRAARHFDYRWPIMYDVTDFSVLQAARDDAGLGQTDVGGIYAYVMIQAFDLTGEARYLDEAKAALAAARHLRFDLNYQANLTAWGAAACIRLAVIHDDEDFVAQAHVFLASFFHNCAIWESQIGHARHYATFLGVSALHDAPYMALYECFDSFSAFEELLRLGSTMLEPAARRLVIDYCRHALDRAWYYFPDALPSDAVAREDIRNGHVDRRLSFPVEDLYIDGQPAGQVGQEIYGAGAAFAFAARSIHRLAEAGIAISCDHFVDHLDRFGAASARFSTIGMPGEIALLVVTRLPRRKLPRVAVTVGGREIAPREAGADRVTFDVPAGETVDLSWDA